MDLLLALVPLRLAAQELFGPLDAKVKDQEGRVENIGVRTTTLRTDENMQILVPNAIVFAEVVVNQSRCEERLPKTSL